MGVFKSCSNRWDGECVMMGDFNEVRSKKERFGSTFNIQGANAFNNFILMIGLVDLSLGEVAQKAKVRWSIKGDENSKYFHGFLNRKRCKLSIRGILMDGEWIVDPVKIKQEFLSHFANRFEKVDNYRIILDNQFPKSLSMDQTLQEVKSLDALEVAQKAKVRWSIKGDENSKYFHGVLNRKRCKLSIRGIAMLLPCFRPQDKYSKKQVDGIGVANREVDIAAMIVGCSTFTTPFYYLGVKVGRAMKKVRNGEDTLFWEEVWLGDNTLKCQFPRVYALETCKNSTIVEKMRHASIEESYRRIPRGGVEHEQQSELDSRLAGLFEWYISRVDVSFVVFVWDGERCVGQDISMVGSGSDRFSFL
nr:RNA-directed DNA polymerase, eukaryota [Tanacetum cinerariifolium]